MVADQIDLDRLAAGVPAGEERGVHRPFVAPLGESEHDREQLPAGLGEVVFVAGRVFAVRLAFDDAGSLAGSELARRQGRRGVAALMRASAAPVHAMVTFGDRRVVPLTRPGARPT